MGKPFSPRRSKKLPQKLRFLIVSEGEVTEEQYIGAVKRRLRVPDANLTFIPPGPTSPKEIVKKARDIWKKSKRDDSYDSVWCIFDVEVKVDQRARLGLAEAMQMAMAHGISVALSNPCFELWLFLHDETREAHITSDEIQYLCSKCGLVSAKKIPNADQLLDKYCYARERAVNLDAKHDRDGTKKVEERNPSSGMYRLVDALFTAFELC